MPSLKTIKTLFLLVPIFSLFVCAPPTNIADDPNASFIKAISIYTSSNSYNNGLFTDTINSQYYFRTRIVLARHVDSIKLSIVGKKSPTDTTNKKHVVEHNSSDDDHDSVYIDSLKIDKADTFQLGCKSFIKNGKILDTTLLFVVKGNQAQFIQDLDTSARIFIGESYTMSVQVSGTAPFVYEWTKDGISIPNSNSPQLVITSASLNQTGNYKCQVSNLYGSSITSRRLYLYVIDNGTPGNKLPEQPTSLKIRERSYNKVLLTWKQNTNSDTFKVYRSTKKDSGYYRISLQTDTLLLDSNLQTQSYYYYITAHNNFGVSKPSDTVSTDDALIYINTKPTLAISGVTNLNISESCTLDIQANDPDLNQTVSIELKNNPVGGSYNSTTKKFIWSSAVETSATITFIATDNGQPAISDTETILITFKKDLPAPAKPTGLIVSERSISVSTLKWKSAAGADTFRVYRSSSKTGTFQLVKATRDSTCKDTGLTAATYFYYIKAFNRTGPSPSSDTISTDSAKVYINSKPKISVSGKPNYTFGDTCVLTATATDPDYPAQIVTITVDALPTGATFDGSKLTWKPSGYLSDLIDTISFIATDNGSPILNDTIKTIVKFVFTLQPPSKPAGLQVVERSATTDSLKWNSLSGADSFKIYRSTAKSGTYQLIKSQTVHTYRDQNLQAKTTYYYYIIALNKAGNSPSSDTISTDQAARYVNAIPQFTIEPSNHAIKQNSIDTLKFTAKDQDLDNLTFEILKIDSLLTIFGTITPKAIELFTNGENATLLFRPGMKTGEITFQVRVSDSKSYDTSTIKVNVTTDEAMLIISIPDFSYGGSTNPSLGSSTLITANTPYQISASPNAGYAFVKWSVISGIASFTDSLIPNPKVTIGKGTTTIKPVFAKKKFTLTISIIGMGTTTPAPGSIQLDSNAVQNLAVTAGSGYRFVGFNVVGANEKVHLTTDPTPTVKLTGDGQIQAVFVKQFTVAMKNTGNGTANASKTTVDSAETIYITATANTGSGFEKWVPSGNVEIANLLNASTTAKILGNVTIEGIFKLGTYQLSILNDGFGTTTPNGLISVSHGVTQNISATPNAGYKFVSWTSVEGAPIITSPNTSSTTVTCTGNSKIQANFAKITYQLTITNDNNGTTTASPATVNHGESFPISATPNSGYNFSSWSVTAGTATIANANSANTSVILTSSNATIRATFVAANRPPVINNAPTNATAGVGNVYTYKLIGSDPDGQTLTFTKANGPTGLTISSQGLVSWEVGWDTPIGESFNVKVKLSDGSLSVESSWDIIVNKHMWTKIPTAQTIMPFGAKDSTTLFRMNVTTDYVSQLEKSNNNGASWTGIKIFDQLVNNDPILKGTEIYIPLSEMYYWPFTESYNISTGALTTKFTSLPSKGAYIDYYIAQSTPYYITQYQGNGYTEHYVWKNNNLISTYYEDLTGNNIDRPQVYQVAAADVGNTIFYIGKNFASPQYFVRYQTGKTSTYTNVSFDNNSILETDQNNADTLFLITNNALYRNVSALSESNWGNFSEVVAARNKPVNQIIVANGSMCWLKSTSGEIYFTNNGFNSLLTNETLPGSPAIEKIFLSADKKTIWAYGNGYLYK